MSLGKKLKQLRIEKGWTQNELAKRSGLARGYLAQLEGDVVANPSAETFLKLARAFNIPPEELYEAAGYIKDARRPYQHKETPEEILDRLRLDMPLTVPIYEEFRLHAGKPVEPKEYVAMVKDRAMVRNLEGYIAHGKCLEPEISEGNIIIIDRDGQIDNGDIVVALFNDELHIGRLRKIAEELYLENNDGRIKLAECQIAAPVIEVRRRLK